jgi:hypothetical protein
LLFEPDTLSLRAKTNRIFILLTRPHGDTILIKAGIPFMHIDRKLSYGNINQETADNNKTRALSGEERISLLEELRHDLGKLLGYDYSGRIERILTVAEAPWGNDLQNRNKETAQP